MKYYGAFPPLILSFFFLQSFCTNIDYRYKKCSSGCVLVPGASSDGREVHLVSIDGSLVRVWKTEASVFMARLWKNDYIVTSEIVFPDDFSVAPGHKPTGALRIYKTTGEKVWEFIDPLIHHDFDILPNGNLLAIRWTPLDKNRGQKIIGGRPGTEWKGHIWGDEVVELAPMKGVVKTSKIHEHLDVAQFAIPSHLSRGDWLHTNSVRYYELNPINGKPSFLVSCRTISKVFLLDAVTMKIIWESPNNLLNYQHDPSLYDNSVLIFDNGTGKGYSRILEIDLKTNKISWEYSGGGTLISKSQFYTPYMGAVEKIGSDRFLVTASIHGYIFVVDKEKNRHSHFFIDGPSNKENTWPYRSVFKTKYYSSQEIDSLL